MFHDCSDRLFFALRPPQPAAAHIDFERNLLGLRKLVRTEYLHSTLCSFDFDPLPTWAIPLIQRIGDHVEAQQFWVAWDHLIGSNESVLLKPSRRISAFYDLRQQLMRYVDRSGLFEKVGRPPEPHLTLAYQRCHGLDQPIDIVSWLVEELYLIHSEVGFGLHTVIGCWPLRPRSG